MSLHLLLYLVAAHSRFLPRRLYAARRISRDEDERPNRLFRFFTVFRALSASALPRASCIAARGRLCISRRLLSFYVVVGPENLTRARLRHRPSYELRAYVNQYICKLFFLCFFSRCDPHFFIITFLYLYLRLLLS